jgi:hypothetical protein
MFASMTDLQKNLCWLCVTIVLIIVVMYLSSKETRTPDQERWLALLLIKTASQQAAIVCRELEEIELKKRNIEIARKLGETELLSAYKKQIEEKEENVLDVFSGYGEAIQKLSELKRAVVLDEFNNHAQFLVHNKLFKKVQAVRRVEQDYQRPREAGKEAMDLEAMRLRCRER